ncbi:MAG: bifunctional (p)ppGpp synthetase/guanosine-3',5'-bis(diphosphate) 3'-pyrophosphohydrolase [Chloroflexi bacterium]|nr:bifunctional (p)ppGpp synthetase/guanosine-3',5'-bis(diphosphate) 3'-pyrophosphohydrolase [Chloroflexota bacterium]
MGIEDVITKIKEFDTTVDFDLLRDSFEFAREIHDGVYRDDGSPYITHPLEVANILANYRLDAETLAAALLHDAVEDAEKGKDGRKPEAVMKEVKERFGEDIAKLVEGVTKINKLSDKKKAVLPDIKDGDYSISLTQAENLRKIFLAMAEDIRVILIKLADRLHNLRTMSPKFSEEKKRRIAEESLNIYAPIASMLGIWTLKSEIEDLSFKILEPEKYADLVDRVEQRQTESQSIIREAIETLKERIGQMGIRAKIGGREKHIFSTYMKMTKRGVPFEEIYDLVAIRVIVNSVQECYTVLGEVNNLWIPFMDRIKDYIARPKPNRYRSLHTSVLGPQRVPLEIQIRTWEMHQVNEFGVASHWAYKEGLDFSRPIQDDYPWLQDILDWKEESKDARAYMETLRTNLLSDDVIYVFTPQGDVINLPAGSTPIDFAYRIHTDVGNTTVGSKVNAKLVPLDHKLENADIVEIVRSKHATPSLDWLRICKSSHTKNKIRNWFKKKKYSENLESGKSMLEAEFKRTSLLSLMDDEKLWEKVIRKLGFSRKDDLLASLGYGETTITQVLNKFKDVLPKKQGEALIPAQKKKEPVTKTKSSQMIQAKDMKGMLISFGRCCNPVYGDDVIGYITLGKGLTIHRKDCPNIDYLTQRAERFMEVEWSSETVPGKKFPVDLRIEAWDRAGLVSEIMNIVNEMDVNILSISASAKKDTALVKLRIQVKDINELKEVSNRIKKVKNVLNVTRATKLTEHKE